MDFLAHFFTNVDVQEFIRVGWAAAAGGLIGLEREMRDRAAGFRTMILIAVGAALVTILSENMVGPEGDVAKIAGYVISGVGFLGAGAIMRDGLKLSGLTTAATIWVTAAVGMTFGSGALGFGTLITAALMLVLWVFPVIERAIDRIREEDSYAVVFDVKKVHKIAQLQAAMQANKLHVIRQAYFKRGAEMHGHWTAIGKPQQHDAFRATLMADDEIKEFTYH